MVEVRQRHISAIDGVPDIDNAPKRAFDAGDKDTFKQAIKDSKQVVATKAETIRWIMSEEKGRKFFFDLLAVCHILRNPFRSNALSMSFECGEMNVGQQIFVDIQAACPELYLKMMDESKQGASNG